MWNVNFLQKLTQLFISIKMYYLLLLLQMQELCELDVTISPFRKIHDPHLN